MTIIVRHPDGWVFEDSDESVGIFAAGWYHDSPDCVDAPDASMTILDEHHEGLFEDRALVTRFRLTCECGATAEVTERTWDPDIPADTPNPWEV